MHARWTTSHVVSYCTLKIPVWYFTQHLCSTAQIKYVCEIYTEICVTIQRKKGKKIFEIGGIWTRVSENDVP
jgi:hypothetical protein